MICESCATVGNISQVILCLFWYSEDRQWSKNHLMGVNAADVIKDVEDITDLFNL